MEVSQAAVNAIIGAFGTLLGFAGGLLALWDGRKRLKIQLENDRTLKAADREIGMRKETYGHVSEALAKFDSYISRRLTSDDPASPEFLQPHEGVVVAMAKASPFASNRTRNAAEALLRYYAGTISVLLGELKELHGVIVDVKLRQESTNSARDDIARLRQGIDSELESGAPNQARVQVLLHGLELKNKQLKDIQEELGKCLTRQIPALARYHRAAINFASGQEQLRRELLESMQIDLGISQLAPPDPRAQAAQAAAVAELQEIALRQFIPSIDEATMERQTTEKDNSDP